MIGKLRGLVDDATEESVILDVHGVGYHVLCSSRTIAALPQAGEMAQLIIETHVREDHIQLFGFPDTVEREWFRLLVSVQRVGNRMALTILGTYTPQQLVHAIVAKDTAAFSRISGVGAKLAERIVTELKDKALKLPTSSFNVSRAATATAEVSKTVTKKTTGKKVAATPAPEPSAMEDSVSALVNLGYTRSEAYSAVMKATDEYEGIPSLDDLIKLSLKQLVRG